MMKKLKITAMLLAMLAALSVTVSADEPADAAVPAETAEITETAEAEEPPAAVISFPGMLEVNVTSSMSAPDTDTARYFDKLAETGYQLNVTEENRTYTVYASVGVRDYVDLLAVQMAGDPCTTVEVAVYASNDDENWVPFDVTAPTEESGFYVFDILGSEERYTFWRIDFTVGMGDGFTLTELALFKQDKGEPEYVYDLGDTVAEGELPELIPATPEIRLDVELVPEKPVKKHMGLLSYVMGFRM